MSRAGGTAAACTGRSRPRMRFVKVLSTTGMTALLAPAALVATATPAAGTVTTTGSIIAALVTANIGKHACSVNSAGTKAFGTSCTGNRGRPEYWCADLAKWVWAQAGVADTEWLSAASGSFYTYGQEYGTISASPAVGDAEIFNYRGGGSASHVAIVTQVNADGTVESVSGDWGGKSGSEARFSSTSTVVANTPAYLGVMGTGPAEMGMTISAFVAPVGAAVAPVAGATTLAGGQTLTAGEEVRSPNQAYALVMQSDGNLVEYLGTRVLWSSGTGGHAGARATVQTDGDVVVYSPTNVALWASGTGGHPGGALVLRDDASFGVTGPTGRLWDYRPNTALLLPGHALHPGQEVISTNGVYSLMMQSDGNLVESTSGRTTWSSGTGGHPGSRAVLHRDGGFVVLSPHNVRLWSSRSGGHTGAFTFTVEPNADLVVHGASGPLWVETD